MKGRVGRTPKLDLGKAWHDEVPPYQCVCAEYGEAECVVHENIEIIGRLVAAGWVLHTPSGRVVGSSPDRFLPQVKGL